MKRSKFGAYLRHAVIHTLLIVLVLFALGLLGGAVEFKSFRAGLLAVLAIGLYIAIAYNLSRHPAFKTQKQIAEYFYYVSDFGKRQILAAVSILFCSAALTAVLWYAPTASVSKDYPNAVTNMQEEFQISPVVMSILHGLPGGTTQLYYAAAEAADAETEDELEAIAQSVISYDIYNFLLVPSVCVCGWLFGIVSRYGVYLHLSHKLEVKQCRN